MNISTEWKREVCLAMIKQIILGCGSKVYADYLVDSGVLVRHGNRYIFPMSN